MLSDLLCDLCESAAYCTVKSFCGRRESEELLTAQKAKEGREARREGLKRQEFLSAISADFLRGLGVKNSYRRHRRAHYCLPDLPFT